MVLSYPTRKAFCNLPLGICYSKKGNLKADTTSSLKIGELIFGTGDSKSLIMPSHFENLFVSLSDVIRFKISLYNNVQYYFNVVTKQTNKM